MVIQRGNPWTKSGFEIKLNASNDFDALV